MATIAVGKKVAKFGKMKQIGGWLEKGKNLKIILSLFILASIIIRYLLASFNSSAPSMIMDEALYFSISRSLFSSAEVLLRGQSVVYEYLLYPLLISPLHALPSSVNIFRAIQFFNAIAISLAAIPAYLLAKKITGFKTKGLLVGIIVLCLPDMVMVRHIMSESIVYPLMLTLFYFFFLAIEDKRPKYALICGILTFLLHITKPGPIVIGLAFVGLFIILFIREKKRERLLEAIYFVGIFVVLFAGYRLFLRFGLGVDLAAAGYYDQQMQPLTRLNIINALNGALVYSLYLPAAFLVLPLLLPLFSAKRLSSPNRLFLSGLSASLLLYLGVIIWTIYIGEMTKDPFATRIHTRYLAMYLPVLFAFCLTEDLVGVKVKPGLIAACTGIAVGWLLLAGKTSGSGVIHSVDAHLLSAFLLQSPLNGHVWMPIIWIGITAYFLYSINQRGFQKKDMTSFSLILLLVLLVSNLSSYALDSYNSNLLYIDEAREAKSLAGNNANYLTKDGQLYWEPSMVIDMAYRGSAAIVSFEDAIEGIDTANKIQSLVPKKPAKFHKAADDKAAANIILNPQLLQNMVIDKSASLEYTANKAYAVITPGAGKGWLHSALYGFNNGWVKEGSSFSLYDPGILSFKEVYLQLQTRAGEGSAKLQLSCGAETREITLSDTLAWYGVYFPVDAQNQPMTITFAASGANVYVKTYLIRGENRKF